MDREGFRNRLKQYKKAREENPGLKYWEWKDVPKYDEGTNNVTSNDDVRTIGDVKLNLFSGIFSPLNQYVDEYATKKAKEIFGDLSISEIRKRMYNNMRPYGYNKPIRRLTTAVKNNEKENIQAGQDNERDDIFAEYLQIPHNERHESRGFPKVVDSQYSPTIGSTNTKYKTLSSFLSPHSEDVEQLITRAHYNRNGHMEFEYLPFGVNKTTTALRKYFGEHTIGRLVDPNRGEYISVYDLWDIAPISDGLDETQGIGKPVSFYDRIYLDDYYNVNSSPKRGEYYGGYLPEVEVKPKKYDEGGRVTLKEKEDAFWRGDAQKMAELVEREGKQLTYVTPQSNLNEVVVTANKPKQNQYSELDFAKDVAGFVPVLGDAIDIYDAGKALYDGNYSKAAMLGAGLLLPNILQGAGKTIKKIWKGTGKNLINYGKTPNRIVRSEEEIRKDLFNSQYNVYNYLQNKDVVARMNNADKTYGTKYKQLADMISNKMAEAVPNYGYYDPLFIPTVVKNDANFAGKYMPSLKMFSFSPMLANKKEVAKTLHHETQHYLDDVSGGLRANNNFLNVEYGKNHGVKNIPELFFDYGLKNILTHPKLTFKNALADKYYFSEPTEIRAYFSEKIFLPRVERGISLNIPFSSEELNNQFINHIIMSRKKRNRENFIRDINNYGFSEGGEVNNPYSTGRLVDSLYGGMIKEEHLGEPWHKYDFTISEEEAERLGYFKDDRGHRDDRVKKEAHPSHPSRGNWKSFYQYDLTDFGMNNPNHTLFGLVDGGLDPLAVLTYKGGIVLPELTITPKKKYVDNSYDNIHLIY